MLITTRFGETEQVHRVEAAGGDRAPAHVPRRAGLARRATTRATAALSSTRAIRAATSSSSSTATTSTAAKSTLLTDGAKRHFAGPWSNRGDRLSFVKVDADADGAFTEIWVIDPRQPESKRKVSTLRGGGWSLSDWSPDDTQLLLREQISEGLSSLWLVDVASGAKRRATPEPGPTDVAWSAGRFDASGETIFLTTDRDSEFRQLAALRLADGKRRHPHRGHPLGRDRGRAVALGQDTSRSPSTRAGSPASTCSTPRSAGAARSTRYPTASSTGCAGTRTRRTSRSRCRPPASAATSSSSIASSRQGRALDARARPAASIPRPSSSRRAIEWTSFDGRKIPGLLYQPDAHAVPRQAPGDRRHPRRPRGSGATELPRRRQLLDRRARHRGDLPQRPRLARATARPSSTSTTGACAKGPYEDIRTLLDWIGKNPHLDAERVLVTGAQLRRSHDVRDRDPLHRSHPLLGGGGRDLQPAHLPRAHPGLPPRPAPRRVRRRARSADARVPRENRAAQPRRRDRASRSSSSTVATIRARRGPSRIRS